MSRRYARAVAPLLAPARDALGGLAVLSARADLCWLARHQRDVAAREAGTGRALTGMPAHRSVEPRLPGQLDGPDLSGEIARSLDKLERELLDVGWQADAETEAKRWLQAAQVVDKACDTDQDALAWWDTASALRARAERVLGPSAAGRYMGRCGVPDCPGEIRMGDDQNAAVCPDCGLFVTREDQTEYVVQEMDRRLMNPSQIQTALVQLRAEVGYDTVKSWARRGKINPPDWDTWPGIPYVVPHPKRDDGRYSFLAAFHLAAKRATMVRVDAVAA